jgi:hypothetical protein
MRRFSIKIACAAAFLLACASALSAQDTIFVHQGARVKVFPIGSRPVIGEVANLSYDTLVILPESNGSVLTFHRRDWRKIEIYRGKKSNIGKGAWIGAVGGVVAGVLVGALVGGDCDGESICITVGAAIGAAGGAILGVGVGALIKNKRWQEAELPAPPPVAVNVGKDGSVRLAFSLKL